MNRMILFLFYLILSICNSGNSQSHFKLGQGTNPTFHPDGKSIAFERNRSIYSMTLSDKKVKKLTNQKWDFAPTWSSDGNYLAYKSYGNPNKLSDGEFAIWILSVHTKLTKKLIENVPRGDQSPRWSKDGKMISWTHGSEIWTSDVNGNNAKPLTAIRANEYECCAEWSPDGSTLAYLACDDYYTYPNYQLRLIDSSGNNQRELSPPIRAYELRWHKADGYIYYSLGNEIMRIYPDGKSKPEKVVTFFNPNNHDISWFDISSDGKWIVYSDEGPEWDGDIYLLKIK